MTLYAQWNRNEKLAIATPAITIGEGQDSSNFDFTQPITFTSTTADATFH